MTAPVLYTADSPSLPTILEGAADPGGITIADLLTTGTAPTDVEFPLVRPTAIAITGLNTSLGAWQYSLDGGAVWLTIQADQINSTTNELALLLGPTAMVRLLPFGELSGTLSDAITFRAWDQSSGSEGDYVVIESTGGDTAFSAASDTASISVTPVDIEPETTTEGTLVASFGAGTYDFATSIVTQPNGQIVVAGVSQTPEGVYRIALARYNKDGSVDTSFNGTGQLVPHFGANDWAYNVAVRPNGNLVISGSTGASGLVASYNADGTPDTSFNGTGYAWSYSGVNFARGLAVQPNGEIVIAGLRYTSTFDFALGRYNADGTLDTGFNGTGSVETDLSAGTDFAVAVELQSNGKIVALGQYNDAQGAGLLELARYNADGSLDVGFNETGMLLTGLTAAGFTGGGLAIQPDGKIVVAGIGRAGGADDFAVIRLLPDGSADTTFGNAGMVVTDMGAGRADVTSKVVVQPNGKILVVGSTNMSGDWNFALVRYNSDGSLDTTFNGTGKVVFDIGNHSNDFAYSVDVQPDGKIVVAGASDAHGTSDFAIARLNADGSLDTDFGRSTAYNYTPHGEPIALSDRIAIYDPALAALDGWAGNYSGATMTLGRHGGNDADDVFSAFGELQFSEGNVVLAGVIVGTVTNEDGGLVIVFNNLATQQRVNGVLSHIAYANTGTAAPPDVVIDYGFSATASASQLSVAAFGPPVVGSVTVHIVGVETDSAPTGGVSIAGMPLWGKTLTASNTIADADGLGAIHYQWLADGSPIDGANGSTFTLGSGEVGKAITVSASFADLLGHEASMTSAATATVQRDAMFTGTAAADTLTGGSGDDTLVGAAGTDSLDGAEGSDLYLVGAASEHAAAEFSDTGTAGIDEVRFSASGSSTLTLFAGDTGIERVVIGTGTGAAAITTATTALSVKAAAVGNALLIVGNAGTNTLTGTAFNDTLDGGAGADKMSGGLGDDTYFVDNTSDVVTEGSASGGTDLVNASVSWKLASNVENLNLTGLGAIIGTGNAAANTITGNSASNVIDGKGGLDRLDGREGSDVYLIGLTNNHAGAEISDSGVSGIDQVRFAATSASTLTLFAGDTGIEQVVIGTGTGATAVTTSTVALNINAAAVANGLSITGNAGANILTGTGYADTLVGGNGNDVLTGGGGADKFVFNFAPNASSNKDTITDFHSGTDVVQLSKAVFAAIGDPIGNLSAEQFWSGSTATHGHDANDRIIYDTATGALYYDADGSGSAAAVQIALIGTTSHPALAYTDIQLIA